MGRMILPAKPNRAVAERNPARTRERILSAALKEFAKISQFIVITHNKKTMQHANVMYGVTMQQRGISKVVSVKFSEYKQDAVPVTSAIQPAQVEAPKAEAPKVEETKLEEFAGV